MTEYFQWGNIQSQKGSTSTSDDNRISLVTTNSQNGFGRPVLRRENAVDQRLDVMNTSSITSIPSSIDDEKSDEKPNEEFTVGVYFRKKPRKPSSFKLGEHQEMSLCLYSRYLQLKKVKKKAKSTIQHCYRYCWFQKDFSDLVPQSFDKDRQIDKSCAVLMGWNTEVAVIVFENVDKRNTFCSKFNGFNNASLNAIYPTRETSETCRINLGNCLPPRSMDDTNSTTIVVYPTDHIKGIVNKITSKLNINTTACMRFEGDDVNKPRLLSGCESPLAMMLYFKNQQNNSEQSIELDSSSAIGYNSGADDGNINDFSTLSIFTLHSATCTSECTKQQLKSKENLSQSTSLLVKFRKFTGSSTNISKQTSFDYTSGDHTNGVAKQVVGIPLEFLYPNGKVQRPVTCLLAYIWHRCKDVKGIFRVPGKDSDKKKILSILDNYDLSSNENLQELEEYSPFSVADALKTYLRQLPGYLLQKDLRNQWLSANNQSNKRDKIEKYRLVIQQMKPHNAHFLHMLVMVLHELASFSDVNQMSASNLARSITVSLLENENNDFNSMHTSMLGSLDQLKEKQGEIESINSLIENLIVYYKQLWPDEAKNNSVLNDFCHHYGIKEETSSVDSVDFKKFQTTKAEHSPSSMSRDSGLHLSDQHLPTTSTENLSLSIQEEVRVTNSATIPNACKAAAPIRPARKSKQAPKAPELNQPPPFDLALKRLNIINIQDNNRSQHDVIVPTNRPRTMQTQPELPIRNRINNAAPPAFSRLNHNQPSTSSSPVKPKHDINLPIKKPCPPTPRPVALPEPRRPSRHRRTASETREPKKSDNSFVKIMKNAFTSGNKLSKADSLTNLLASPSPIPSEGRPSRSRSRDPYNRRAAATPNPSDFGTGISSDDLPISRNAIGRQSLDTVNKYTKIRRSHQHPQQRTKLPQPLAQTLANEKESYV